MLPATFLPPRWAERDRAGQGGAGELIRHNTMQVGTQRDATVKVFAYLICILLANAPGVTLLAANQYKNQPTKDRWKLTPAVFALFSAPSQLILWMYSLVSQWKAQRGKREHVSMQIDPGLYDTSQRMQISSSHATCHLITPMLLTWIRLGPQSSSNHNASISTN